MIIGQLKLFLIFLLICANLGDADSNLEPFSLEECLNNSFVNKGFNGTWISDDSFVFRGKSSNLYEYNVTNSHVKLFLNISILINYPKSSGLHVAPDTNFVLIFYNTTSVFRKSKTAKYAIYNRAKDAFYDVANKSDIQFLEWDPSGKGITYVLKNNIYYFESPEKTNEVKQLTFSGVPGVVYNGVPDWVYEEEVFTTFKALWFSPNGTKLAFASFNDSEVEQYHYTHYGEVGKLESQYPEIVTIRYPKPGRKNPTVSLNWIDLKNNHSKPIITTLALPNGSVSDILIGVAWKGESELTALYANRVQNVVNNINFPLQNNSGYIERSLRYIGGWSDEKAPLHSKDGKTSLYILPQSEGDDKYHHLVLKKGTEVKRLTRGRRAVDLVYAWDEKRDLIYYYGSLENKSSGQHVFVYDLKRKTDSCLTCRMVTPEGYCKFAGASFSRSYSNYAKICNGPGPTVVEIANIHTDKSFVLQDNSELRKQLSRKLKPEVIEEEVEVGGGFKARARMFVPPGFKQTRNGSYPVLVDVYGGPSSKKISDSFSIGLMNYLVTNRRYVYISIDGRGTSTEGLKKKFAVYRNLGKYEILDQIAVTKYLLNKYSFLARNKTGIWGWSYGGFATAWILARDSENVFQAGLSVAPVTNFVYYDSIYTERYMGLPTKEDNFEGYNNTDLSSQVEKFRHKQYFIIHGNADDNVHYQHSMLFVKALEASDVMFFQQSYPDENHALASVRPHLYHSIDRFFAYAFSNVKDLG